MHPYIFLVSLTRRVGKDAPIHPYFARILVFCINLSNIYSLRRLLLRLLHTDRAFKHVYLMLTFARAYQQNADDGRAAAHAPEIAALEVPVV